MANVIHDIISLLSPDAADSLSFLSVPKYLNDELAEGILVKSGLANGNAPDVVAEIRSLPIWHKKNRTSWSIDDDVREHVLSKLNGSAESTRRRVLNALREIRQQPEALSPAFNLRRFDLQLARLSLTVEQEQPSGVAALRQFFSLHHDETSRVVDLYIDESLPAEIPTGTLPDHLRSAYFMRGMYAYRNKRPKDALRFLEPVWKRRGGSSQSCHDTAIAAHIVGLIWSKESRRQQDAEKAFQESLDLGKDDSHHQAQVWHSLGNLLSKNRQRDKEAEDAYRKSLVLRGADDQFGQAQVWHSLGNLLSKNRQRDKEAEDAYRKSLVLEERNGNVFGQAQVWHSLGNLLSKNRQRDKEAEDAYRKSLMLAQDNSYHQAQVWHSLGNLLSKNRQRDKEAEDAYRKSLVLAQDNSYHQTQVWHSLGNLLSKNRQRDKEAEDAYRKSLVLLERLNDQFGQAQVWHSLGNLLSKNRMRWPEAEELYQKSYEFLRKSGDRRGMTMVARSYGLPAIEQGDYDKAEKYLRIALDNERNDFYRDTIAAKLEEVARKKAGR